MDLAGAEQHCSVLACETPPPLNYASVQRGEGILVMTSRAGGGDEIALTTSTIEIVDVVSCIELPLTFNITRKSLSLLCRLLLSHSDDIPQSKSHNKLTVALYRSVLRPPQHYSPTSSALKAQSSRNNLSHPQWSSSANVPRPLQRLHHLRSVLRRRVKSRKWLRR